MKVFLILSASTILTACVFNFDLTSQRTALENQVMGDYQELDDELILMSTLRERRDIKGAKLEKDREELVGHRQNQEFNRDDLDELKSKGMIGETSEGLVAMVPSVYNKNASLSDLNLATLLITEENQDRRSVWRLIVSKNRNLRTSDISEVGKAYASMKHEELSEGHWYQDKLGQWQKKKNKSVN